VLDSDGDGVFDYMDKCPDTPRGVEVDKDGCPLPAAAAAESAPAAAPAAALAAATEAAPPPRMLELRGANFDFDRSNIRQDDVETLDRSAATLKEWGEVKIEVAGHTDSVDSDAYNLKLSQRRAEAVRAYLIEKGIAADRLIAKGYGEASPVADNSTAEGRFRNRRVELIPQQ